MQEFGSIVEGREVPSRQWIEIHNPYTGRLTGRVAAVDRATTLDVLARARARKIRLPRHEVDGRRIACPTCATRRLRR